jgi:hypothetical protein
MCNARHDYSAMRRASWITAVFFMTAVARAQPVSGPTPERRGADLSSAAREGARAFVTARLDRLRDMATTDLAPLDEGPSNENPVVWPGGERATETAWDRCDLAGTPTTVDLRAGELLPVSVSLASRGERAVALVSLGRPGGNRHGMLFPESRWVEWNNGEVQVFPGRGFLPGATLAMTDRETTVLAYQRVDPSTPEERNQPYPDVHLPMAVAITQVEAGGRIVHGPNQLERSEGWQIDSSLVRWDHGSAVVLGAPVNPPEDSRRYEVLHFLDARGRPVRPPLELSDQSRDDGLGAPIAGLVAAPDGNSLAASWMIPSGPIAGVWVRRGITLQAQPFVPGTARIADPPPPAPGTPMRRAPSWYPRGAWSYRVAQGEGFWGPITTRGGVMFRRITYPIANGAPHVEVLLSPWVTGRERPLARALGTWSDPLPVWSSGGAVVAAFARTPTTALSVSYTARGERALRDVTLALDASPPDVAVAPIRTGALLAWIDAPPDVSRRLEFARITCTTATAGPQRTQTAATQR